MVRSSLPEARTAPSGDHAIVRMRSLWPSSTALIPPVVGSHSRTVLSLLAEAKSPPSGDHATADTGPRWPSKTPRSSPVLASQRRRLQSTNPPDASKAPSGDQSTQVTLPSCSSTRRTAEPAPPTRGRLVKRSQGRLARAWLAASSSGVAGPRSPNSRNSVLYKCEARTSGSRTRM